MEILTANKYMYVQYKGLNISLSSTNGVKKSKYSDKELYYVNLQGKGKKYKAIGWTRTLDEGLEMYYQAFLQAIDDEFNPIEFSPVSKDGVIHECKR